MANSCLHILSKKEYTATRCQDGILLFWPIEGSMHFQQFMKERILSDELYICLLYTSPSPRDQRGSRMPSSA